MDNQCLMFLLTDSVSSPRRVSDCEHARREPDDTVLRTIASALGLPASFFARSQTGYRAPTNEQEEQFAKITLTAA